MNSTRNSLHSSCVTVGHAYFLALYSSWDFWKHHAGACTCVAACGQTNMREWESYELKNDTMYNFASGVHYNVKTAKDRLALNWQDECVNLKSQRFGLHCNRHQNEFQTDRKKKKGNKSLGHTPQHHVSRSAAPRWVWLTWPPPDPPLPARPSCSWRWGWLTAPPVAPQSSCSLAATTLGPDCRMICVGTNARHDNVNHTALKL